MQPLVLCACEVDAEPVCDTGDDRERPESSVSEADLACPTWEAEMLARAVPRSQALADRLVAAGQVGIVVPSFAHGAGAANANKAERATSYTEVELVAVQWRGRPTGVSKRSESPKPAPVLLVCFLLVWCHEKRQPQT